MTRMYLYLVMKIVQLSLCNTYIYSTCVSSWRINKVIWFENRSFPIFSKNFRADLVGGAGKKLKMSTQFTVIRNKIKIYFQVRYGGWIAEVSGHSNYSTYRCGKTIILIYILTSANYIYYTYSTSSTWYSTVYSICTVGEVDF
jgi:hypothetical protein